MDGLLKGVTVYQRGELCKRDIAFRQGKITNGISPDQQNGIPVVPIDSIGNCIVLPGFVDVHVHLREPGFSYKETIQTGTRAAAHGGYTTVCAMPNLNPAPDTPAHLAQEEAIIRRDALINVLPYATITRGQLGKELVDFAALAPQVCGFSDDGHGVQSDSMMRQAMESVKALGGLIAAHCEQNDLLHGGYIHDGAYCHAHGHKGISAESEWRPIARDVQLAKETGCRYHVCHVSCKESVEVIRRAKAEGADVTCETAPHYLLLCDEDLQEDGRFKMNPPLRSREDQEALLTGVLDGTIDIIATDHAPHSAAEKARGLEKSAMGITGLECAFPALYTGLVKTGKVPLTRLIEMMTDAPRRRFGLPPMTFEAGQTADLTVWNLEKSWTIDPTAFCSMGHATPFTGTTVYGTNELTLAGGKTVWQC